jgi:transposase
MHDAERRRLAYQVQQRKDRGQSERQISSALGIHRQTVKKLLQEIAERRERGESALEREVGPPPVRRSSKLDPYVELIDAELKKFENITAERLHEKLQDAGFKGGYTIVREYLNKLRGSDTEQRAFDVVETPVGEQGLFDWSPYDLPGCGQRVQVWGYSLGYSRGRAFEAWEHSTQPIILSCLKNSFESHGGVPHQLVTDTMPGVVDGWECNKPILNVRFVDFAAHYGFSMDIAPRRCPRYKGKKERCFRYINENLLNGREFRSLEDFKEVLAWWINARAMQQEHPRTKLPIAQMLEEEQPFLKPLPAHPYDTREVLIRIVDPYGHVPFKTNSYPVPGKYVGQMVYLCADRERLEILDRRAHRLAEHERLPDGAGIRPVDPDPYRRRYDLTLLLERLGEWGEIAQAFGKRLQQKKRYSGPELSYIIDLQLRWSADDIVQALSHAMNYDAYDARSIERILQARFTPRTLQTQIAESARTRIRELMRHNPVRQRPLTDYRTLRTGDTPSLTNGETPRASHQDRADQASNQAADSGSKPESASAPEPESEPVSGPGRNTDPEASS